MDQEEDYQNNKYTINQSIHEDESEHDSKMYIGNPAESQISHFMSSNDQNFLNSS